MVVLGGVNRFRSECREAEPALSPLDPQALKSRLISLSVGGSKDTTREFVVVDDACVKRAVEAQVSGDTDREHMGLTVILVQDIVTTQDGLVNGWSEWFILGFLDEEEVTSN